jgi:hypothetical protein
VPGDHEGGKTHEGGGWVQRKAHEVGKESGRGPQKKNKEITKSAPISSRDDLENMVGKLARFVP